MDQFTLHVTVHQPNDNAPGLALGPYGMWFNRLETWAEQARAWTDYIARSSYMLQQGRAVVDVAYFYGEEGPATMVNQAHAPEITDGYNYDFVNRESLLNEFSVEGGKLVTKSGMKYQLLYLGGTSNRMTLPVLEKLRALMMAGALVVGLPPVDSPSMSDDVTRWRAIARELWPDKSLVHKVGSGKVYQTVNLGQVLGAEAIRPDFAYVNPFPDTTVKFYHRVDGNTDIYFVNNRSNIPAAINGDFRVTGRAPEIWMADRGTIRPASYHIHDGITTVPLRLEPWDAVFVVFREPAGTMSRTVVAPVRIKLVDVKGPWEVEFQPGRGAPKSATFDELSDWSNNANPGIKYFSGTATYTKKIEIPETALSQRSQIEIDLGKVHEVAEVSVNGKTEGIAWKPPYRVNITGSVKAGENTLSIKVANLWPNRLIGDQQPGAVKVAFAPNSTYRANSPLMPSGFIGPVEIDLLTEIK